MNDRATTVAVNYRDVDGYHFFSSDEVKGLFVCSSELDKAFHDVCNVIPILMKANHGVNCTATPLMSFEEFLAETNNHPQIRGDAQTRTFALQMAA